MKEGIVREGTQFKYSYRFCRQCRACYDYQPPNHTTPRRKMMNVGSTLFCAIYFMCCVIVKFMPYETIMIIYLIDIVKTDINIVVIKFFSFDRIIAIYYCCLFDS